MNPSLQAEVTRLLQQEFELKDKGTWLREGRCPTCQQKSLYTNAAHPWVVKCGRESCSWGERHVKDLYPDLFGKWSERYQRSDASPNAAADAYLTHARGFDISKLKGCYTQETYTDRDIGATTATVRFPMPGGGYWERLIDQPERFGGNKARFNYGSKHAGHVWMPPGLDLSTADEIWIVEGIFDCIALWSHGITAVSAMSCNLWPEHFLADLAKQRAGNRPTLVWALDTDGTDDDDAPGQRYIRRWVKQARTQGWDCAAAQIPQGDRHVDWNDLHLLDKLGTSHLKTYRHEGALLIARSASAKALLIYGQSGRSQFPFAYGNQLWWFELDYKKYSKMRTELAAEDKGLTDDEIAERALAECNAVYSICTAYPRALYFLRNDITDESWYYFRINQPGGRAPVKRTFTGGAIMAAAEFGKRLASVSGGALFDGTTGQLMQLMKDQMRNGIKTVETIDFLGYSKEHAAYIFGDVAVKSGVVYKLNSEDYFEIGRLNVKSLLQSMALKINTRAADYTDAWFAPFWVAFGVKGVISLAFWLGSLFAEQIRAGSDSYPFLELIGEAGSGKSTLLEFLWKLCGRPGHEGTDPTKSTLAGRTRTFGQVGNLPMVLIEADRGSGAERTNTKQFDWDELKTLFNGRIGRARGQKSAGNETYEPPFRGSVVISQNAVVVASDAVLQRIVHINLDKSGHTREGGIASKTLSRWKDREISGWILSAVRQEKAIMATLADTTDGYEAMLRANPALKSVRICKNHAQMMACVEALEYVVPITAAQKKAALNALVDMAIARQQAINADHPLVQEFWETVEYLEATTGQDLLNHSRDDGTIAINLPHFAEVAARHGLTKVPSNADLKRLLPDCRMHKFVGRKAVNSAIFLDKFDNTGKTVKCWVFERARSA